MQTPGKSAKSVRISAVTYDIMKICVFPLKTAFWEDFSPVCTTILILLSTYLGTYQPTHLLLLLHIRISESKSTGVRHIWFVEMNNSTEYTIHNDPFYVSPNVPPFIYTASCVLMFFTTIFGIPANTSIFVLFFNTPLVSTTSHYIIHPTGSLGSTRCIFYTLNIFLFFRFEHHLIMF